jgi:alkylhydroperoxidase family enzyme
VGALDTIEWETCLLEPVQNREAWRFLRKELGIVPPAWRYFLDSSWLIRAAARFDLACVPMLHVPVNLSEMLALVVSQESSCRYCYTATRSVMKILGFPAARIRRLEEDFLSADLTPREKTALEFARCVARAAPLATCTEAQPLLDAGYAPDAVKELAFFAAVNVFFNRLSTLPALPPEEVEFARRWDVRVLRPLIAMYVRPRRGTRAEFLSPAQREGPFAEFVNALDGLPAAARLRAVIDDAWQSPALGRRAKGLVFAVVARGIGCPLSEQEAVRLLVDEGMTAADVEHALTHLSGADLDARERAAASLARESIWYRPAALQRHARSIRPLFSREQFVELIGVAALANMICRLAVAVDVTRQAS